MPYCIPVSLLLLIYLTSIVLSSTSLHLLPLLSNGHYFCFAAVCYRVLTTSEMSKLIRIEYSTKPCNTLFYISLGGVKMEKEKILLVVSRCSCSIFKTLTRSKSFFLPNFAIHGQWFAWQSCAFLK